MPAAGHLLLPHRAGVSEVRGGGITANMFGAHHTLSRSLQVHCQRPTYSDKGVSCDL